MNVRVTIHFPRGYIANPYWPAMERVITIRKQSGVDRARNEAKRAAALKAWLDKHDMTMDDYRRLETEAARPFYTLPSGEIIIPAHHLHGFLGETAAVVPAAMRLAKPEQIRTLLRCSDFATGKHKADGTYERFVRNPLTNQRRLQTNEYIADVTATGLVHVVNDEQAQRAREFFAFGGREIGLGAARKMDWGRFEVIAWVPAA